MNNYFKNYLDNNNTMSNNLYDADEGFIRGNLFNNLYSQYKEYKPYKLIPTNKQAEDLLEVDKLTFAAHELNLLLDIYPNNEDILNQFNDYKNKANLKITEYEKAYGPIELNSAELRNIPWAWDNSSWPWEGTNV